MLRFLRRPTSPTGAAVREVEVASPGKKDEGTWVFLTGAFIVLCLIYLIAFERYGFSDPGAATTQSTQNALLPYQVLFRDIPSPEQRVFRQMQEGLVEAMTMRSSTGAWPTIEGLAKEGIPPFAKDLLDKSGLRWTLRQQGLVFEYVGVPTSPAPAAAYLILIQEPDPVTGERANPALVDEEHQLLPDGKLLHVMFWKRPADSVPQDLIRDPGLQGWSQIRVKTRLEEVEAQQQQAQ